MITVKDASVIFYAHYIASKVGSTGLTVTVDVWEVARDGTATEIVSGGSATEIGDGLYRYLLAAGSVDAAAEYIATFKTSDGTVDQRDIPAIWVIDRPTYADNIMSAIWSEALPGTYTSAQAGGILGRVVANVWSYIVRTLTQAADSLQDIIDGATVTRKRGDYWSVSRTGLGDISGRTALYVTMKSAYDNTDAKATLKIEENDGLQIAHASDDVTDTDAAIAIDDETLGNITYTVKSPVTVDMVPAEYIVDVQMIDANGPQTLEEHGFIVTADVTRATS